jgi:hypothetical protein
VATESGARNAAAHDHIALGSKCKTSFHNNNNDNHNNNDNNNNIDSGHMSNKGDLLMGKVDEKQASGAALSPTFGMIAKKGVGKGLLLLLLL